MPRNALATDLDDSIRKDERIASLEAENRRLREALEKVEQRLNESSTGEIGLLGTIHATHSVARAALQGGSTEPK